MLWPKAAGSNSNATTTARSSRPTASPATALTDCSVGVFQSLKRKRLIASLEGGPYRITRLGLSNLRAQLDNRVGAKAW